MQAQKQPSRRVGRPPRVFPGQIDTREALVRLGTEILTEKGFLSTGIEEVLKRAGVTTEIGLADAIAKAPEILGGQVRGRIVVDVNR